MTSGTVATTLACSEITLHAKEDEGSVHNHCGFLI